MRMREGEPHALRLGGGEEGRALRRRARCRPAAGHDQGEGADRQARSPLGHGRSEHESDRQRHRGKRVAEVVDEIRKERNAPAQDVNDQLGERGRAQNQE